MMCAPAGRVAGERGTARRMSKIVNGGKVSPACGHGHIIRGETEEETLRLAGEHAVKEYGLQPTPELIAMVKQHIENA
jgi:hypothetical protein